jgi:probable F420-dependent oxidoreductase
VKLDARLRGGLDHVAADARTAEELGFDGAWNSENDGDAFLPITLAAEHSSTMQVGSSVAIAFARTPMTVAYMAHDLARFSGGRFVLGLGSQIKPHITRRFGMPWSAPAARMTDFVLALRAIWSAWETGEPLRYRGDFYENTLMTPNFVPPANPFGAPPVFLAAVGPHMLRTTAEVADGLFVHPFCTAEYLRSVIVPALARPGAPVEIALSAFVALSEADVAAVRKQISFYGSTPAYRPVLDLHGWGDLHTELNALSKRGQWDEMVSLVPDELVHAMCSVGSAAEVAADLHARYGGLAHRIRFNLPGDQVGPGRFAELVAAMRA